MATINEKEHSAENGKTTLDRVNSALNQTPFEESRRISGGGLDDLIGTRSYLKDMLLSQSTDRPITRNIINERQGADVVVSSAGDLDEIPKPSSRRFSPVSVTTAAPSSASGSESPGSYIENIPLKRDRSQIVGTIVKQDSTDNSCNGRPRIGTLRKQLSMKFSGDDSDDESQNIGPLKKRYSMKGGDLIPSRRSSNFNVDSIIDDDSPHIGPLKKRLSMKGGFIQTRRSSNFNVDYNSDDDSSQIIGPLKKRLSVIGAQIQSRRSSNCSENNNDDESLSAGPLLKRSSLSGVQVPTRKGSNVSANGTTIQPRKGSNASAKDNAEGPSTKRLSKTGGQIHNRRHSNLSSLHMWKGLFSPDSVVQGLSPEFAKVQENLQLIERFRIFTPATLHRQVSQKHRVDPNAPIRPHSVKYFSSLLLADISGFTRLSSRLSAEELKLHINEYFSKLIGVIKINGGDVIKFLGDAVLIMFPVNVDDLPEVKRATALMASLCALSLIKECGKYDQGEGASLVSLRLHCGVGCGEVHGMCLGEGSRWEYLVSGEPLSQIGKCLGQASTGEVCVSDEAYAMIADMLEVKILPAGGRLLTGRRCALCLSPLKSLHRTGDLSSIALGSNSEAGSPPGGQRLSGSIHGLGNSAHEGSSQGGSSKRGSISTNAVEDSIPHSPSVRQNSHLINRKSPMKASRVAVAVGDGSPPLAVTQEPMPRPSCTQGAAAPVRKISLREGAESVKSDFADSSPRTKPTVSFSSAAKYEEVGSNESPIKDNFAVSSSVSSKQRSFRDNVKLFFISSLMVRKADCDIMPIKEVDDDNADGDCDDVPKGEKAATSGLESNINGQGFDFSVSNSCHSNAESKESTVARTSKLQCRSSEAFEMDDSKVVDRKALSRTKSYEGDFSMLTKWSKAVSFRINGNADPFPLLKDNPHVELAKKFLSGYLIQDKKQSTAPIRTPYGVSNGGSVAGTCAANGESVENNEKGAEDLVLQDSYIPEILPLFVHEAAKGALESVGTSYLFELRNVTTLFVNVLGLEEDFNQGDFQRPQAVIEICLAALNRFGGSLRQYTVDDKGCVLIGAFGLPGSTHEDNNRRAVDAATSMQNLLKDAEIGCAIGIAEGRVFCGLVGSAQRCEYAMMGSSVNLAARLMCKCSPGEILVNESVYQSSNTIFSFTPLPRMVAKGFEKPVAVYKPTNRIYKGFQTVTAMGSVGFVGRETELEMAVDFISTAISDDAKNVIRAVSIEGVAGVGKTCLVAEAVRIAGERRGNVVKVASGQAKTGNVESPFFVVAQLIDSILRLGKAGPALVHASSVHTPQIDMPTIRSRRSSTGNMQVPLRGDDIILSPIKHWLHTHIPKMKKDVRLPPYLDGTDSHDISKDIMDYLPLLGDVLSHKCNDNEITKSLSLEQRSRCIEDVVLYLILCSMLACEIELIIIDNLQWIDLQSIHILSRLTNELPVGMVLFIFRDSEDTLGENSPQIQAMLLDYAQQVYLNTLDGEDIRTILKFVIGNELIQAQPQVLLKQNVTEIMTRAGGLPFHALTIALALKSALEAGSYKDIHDLPVGVQSAIIERFDRLGRPEQLILKSASVLGVSFDGDDLAQVMNVLQILTSDHAIASSLLQISVSRLIIPGDYDGSYFFADKSVQETVYNLMTESQRSNIHEVFAELLENNGSVSDSGENLQMILYHYDRSSNTNKKVFYKRAAAHDAKRRRRYQFMYRQFHEVLQAVTGIECEALIKTCFENLRGNGNKPEVQLLTKDYKRLSLISSSIKFSVQKVDDVTLFQRISWLAAEDLYPFRLDIRSKINTSISDITVAQVTSWVAELSIAQYMLGNYVDSHNLMHLFASCWKLEISSSKKLSFFDNLISSITHSPLPALDSDVFSTVMLSLEILMTLYLLRGLPETAVTVARQIANYVQRAKLDRSLHNLFSSKAFSAKLIAYGIISDVLLGTTMLAISRSMKEKVKARKLFDSARDKASDSPFENVTLRLTYLTHIAMSTLAEADVSSALLTLSVARSIAADAGDLVSQSQITLGRAWCAFFIGDLNQALECLDDVTSFCRVSAHKQFQIWTLEFHMLLKCFSKDLTGINIDINFAYTLRSVEVEQFKSYTDGQVSRNGLSAPTNAIIAFALSSNGQFERALPYALHACTRLSEKTQSSTIPCVYLFCAVFALLDTMEYGNSASGSFPDAAIENHMALVRQCISAFELLCIRYPCLVPLWGSLKFRIERMSNKKAAITELDKLLDDPKLHSEEFVFGMAYFHHERASYCQKYLFPTAFRSNLDSRELAISLFAKLGRSPTGNLPSERITRSVSNDRVKSFLRKTSSSMRGAAAKVLEEKSDDGSDDNGE